MKHVNIIPACHPYIKDKNTGESDYSKIFSVVYYAYRTNFPKKELEPETLLQFLSAAQIVPGNLEVNPLTMEKSVTCYSIISEYKCNFICQLCAYSPLYKNKLETEETLLLSYALQSWENLLFLLNNQVNCRLLRSLLLLNPHGGIPTLPINRLAFEYLERIANEKTNFLNLPADITNALEQNNKKRLTQKELSAVRSYLKNLQTEYTQISQERITHILQSDFKLSSQIAASNNTFQKPEKNEKKLAPEKDKPKVTTSDSKDNENICLNGLLNQASSISINKNQKIEKTDPPKTSKLKPDLPVTPKTTLTTKAPAPAPINTGHDIHIESKEISFTPPAIFSPEQNGGYPFVYLDGTGSGLLRDFKNTLLMNPEIAIEIVTDSNNLENVLIFAETTFYYFSTTNNAIIDIMCPYFVKSIFRNLICFDSFRLYYFLQKNNLNCDNVFSIRTAHSILAETQNRNKKKTPEEVVKELLSEENSYNLQFYIFAMRHYRKMFHILMKNKTFDKKDVKIRLENTMHLNSLLGISFCLFDTTQTDQDLFSYDPEMNHHFKYDSNTKMKSGYYSVTYELSSKSSVGIGCLVTDVIISFAKSRLSRDFSYRLLSYKNDSFTIACTENDYPLLCEFVSNIVTFLAEQKNIAPVYIYENRSPV